MGSPDRLSRGDWEAVLHAPLLVYSTVASVDGAPMEAQFRRLREEILAGRGAFAEASIGHTMIEALAENLDVLWEGYQASSRSAQDGLKRLMKVLRKAPEEESVTIRDWLLVLAMQIAEARRMVGETSVSPTEDEAIRDLAAWLDRSVPEPGQG